MDQLSTIIGNLFALNPSAAPAGVQRTIPGGTAPAPAARAPVEPIDDSPQAKVLATLQNRSTPQIQGGGPFGAAVGPLPDVKGKSKGSAFATGLAAGMNNAQNLGAANAKGANDAASTNLKTMAALFSAGEQTRANDIRQQNSDALKKYYEGTVKNGAARANATNPKDIAANEHTIEMTKRSAATRFGLNSPQLAKDMGSMIPSVKSAAEAEYKRRKEGFDTWERSFNGRVGAGADPVDAAVGAHVKTGTDGAPDAGGGPATPPADPAKAGVTPPAGKPATATQQPETWQPIRNSKDGSMWLFNPATGDKKPMGGQPAAPSPSFPSPFVDEPEGPAPALDDEEE